MLCHSSPVLSTTNPLQSVPASHHHPVLISPSPSPCTALPPLQKPPVLHWSMPSLQPGPGTAARDARRGWQLLGASLCSRQPPSIFKGFALELCTLLVEILQITVTEVAGSLPLLLPVCCPSPCFSPFATKSQPVHLSGSISLSFLSKFSTASFSFPSSSLYPQCVSPAGSAHPDGTPFTPCLCWLHPKSRLSGAV